MNEQMEHNIVVLKENESEKLEVNNKSIDSFILHSYDVELKYMIDYYDHIFQLIKDKEGNSGKLDEEYRSICAAIFTKFVELIELVQIVINFFPI